ncbi:adhesion G-protein coupled receptor G2 [Drosophila serrata]|uniref:adhesion G-protein coupled receptor G2 n=1 Tax=Drosophila serrata TaxID=7274 RepID=UPI000A1D332B|nr:adhesion G-protein coupled receptor G2 [Drosophila serrata]
MPSLVFLCLIAGNIALAYASKDSSEETQHLNPADFSKCLDYCHLKNVRFLLCIGEDGKLEKSPLKDCTEGDCKAEDFQIKYETKDGYEYRKNRVEATKVGKRAHLRDLCLDERNVPRRRRCQIRNGTKTWQSFENVTCRMAPQLSTNLDTLAVKNSSDLSQLSDLITHSKEPLNAADIVSISEIFSSQAKKSVKKVDDIEDLMNICQQVMSTDSETLRLAAEQNATNALLSNFEEYLDALAPQLLPGDGTTSLQISRDHIQVETQPILDKGVVLLRTKELSVFFVDPSIANVTGIAIFPEGLTSQFRILQSSENLEDIRAIENLESAAILPEKLWRDVKERGARYLIFKVYARDALFVETAEELKRRPTSNVISITIPGLDDHNLPGKLPFFLRNGDTNKSHAQGGCGYWNYETWLSDGISTSGNDSEIQLDNLSHPVILCHASHLTQFTFLLGVRRPPELITELTSGEELPLDIITNVGLSLSLMGLLAIFVTAALFQRFRNLASTKILLNLCVALGLQLSLFLVLSEGDLLTQLSSTDFDRCLVTGALMQYLLLVVFSWMFIIGWLQYKRYVKVIGVKHPKHYILMSALVAWTLPLIPTLLVVFLDSASYRPSGNATTEDIPILCYPSGYGLGLGVILPIGLITLFNVVMLGYINWSVHRALFTQNLILKQLHLSVLLFFLLGVTWIFGLCAFFDFGKAFSYLFCITATMQGFVLFLYFVVFNKDNRKSWLGLCRLRRPKHGHEMMGMEMGTESNFKNSSRTHSTSN